MSKQRAKISILSELFSFASIRSKDWGDTWHEEAKIGDLVSMSSAPESKWYLSWLLGTRDDNGYKEYLLESIEDGELIWWSNIGLEYYIRKRILERPTWKWDDKQFAFNDRWNKVCKRNGSYIVLPMLPVFHDDGSITLNVRIRFGLSEFRNPQKFPNWKKLFMKEMESYYKTSAKKYNETPKEIKSIRDN